MRMALRPAPLVSLALILAALVPAPAQATPIVAATVTPAGSLFHYDYTVTFNPLDDEIALLTIVVAPGTPTSTPRWSRLPGFWPAMTLARPPRFSSGAFVSDQRVGERVCIQQPSFDCADHVQRTDRHRRASQRGDDRAAWPAGDRRARARDGPPDRRGARLPDALRRRLHHRGASPAPPRHPARPPRSPREIVRPR